METRKRPDSITIRLLAGGTEKESKAVTAADNWSCTFDNLPKMENGQTIAYTVSEDGVTGYETAITGDATSGYTITNTHTPETISVEGTKTWDDSDNQDGTRPESITIRLLANGVEKDTATVTADTDGNWTYSFTNLPKYANGQEIRYTITEDAVAGYTQTINGYDVTNSYTPKETSVTVTKSWDDGNNQDGKRPTSVTVKLLANGEDTSKTVILNAGNNWQATFTGLAVNNDGNTIEYTVAEETVTDYETVITGDATKGFTITNKHTPETITVSGTKTWDDNDNAAGERPTSITVKLLANNVEKTSKTVTADADGEWEYSFTGLPKYENGQEIAYTVTEDAVADYAAEVDDNNNIKNTYDNDTSVTVNVSKVWDDNDNQANKRPASVTVKLLKNSIATEQTVTLNESNAWKDSFRGLEKYENGVLISYTVEEVSVENYTKAVTGNVTDGFTVTNTYAPPKTSVTVTKKWVHGENTTAANQPTSVTIKLLANGADTGKTLELTASNAQQDGSWKGEFTDLDKYDESGNQITYTIEESAVGTVEGYDYVSSVNGYTVTNAYNKTSVSVSKVWNHGDNKEKPSSVTVNLLANDTATGTTVTLNADNDWSHTFTDLTRYDDNGREIVYTVSEEPITNYTPVITSDAANGFTITNTYRDQTPPTPATGSLTITKTTIGATTPDTATFNVLDKDGVNRGSITYSDLKATGSHTFTGLAPGTYTVKESGAEVSDYTLVTTYSVTEPADANVPTVFADAFEDVAAYTQEISASVSVKADGVSTVDFINTYTKEVVPPTTPTTDKFRLTLNKQVLGVDNLPADYAVTVTVSNMFGPVKTLTLKANEPQTIYLSGGEYTLTENAPAIDGYTLKSQEFSADSFNLTYGGKDVTITNTYAKDAEDPEEPKDNKDQDDKNPPAEPKDPSDDNDADDESDVPKTGDSMSFFLYVLTAAGALFGLKKLSKRETE